MDFIYFQLYLSLRMLISNVKYLNVYMEQKKKVRS